MSKEPYILGYGTQAQTFWPSNPRKRSWFKTEPNEGITVIATEEGQVLEVFTAETDCQGFTLFDGSNWEMPPAPSRKGQPPRLPHEPCRASRPYWQAYKALQALGNKPSYSQVYESLRGLNWFLVCAVDGLGGLYWSPIGKG